MVEVVAPGIRLGIVRGISYGLFGKPDHDAEGSFSLRQLLVKGASWGSSQCRDCCRLRL